MEQAMRHTATNKHMPMKTLRILMAGLGMAAALSLRAAPAAPAGRVEVVFDHPENFTDIKDQYQPTDKGMQAIMDQIRDYIVDRASPMIPAGYRFRITFTDIDLAGEFEPWRGPRWDMVRIIRPVYPPAFKFTYAVTDPSGKVVRQGSEFVRDLSFQFRTVLDTTDALRYEKQLLNDWIRFNLAGIKKA